MQKCFFLFELNIFFSNSLLKQTEYVCFWSYCWLRKPSWNPAPDLRGIIVQWQKLFIANCKSRAVSSCELLGCWLMLWQITDNRCNTPRFPVEKQKTLNLWTTTRHPFSNTIMYWERLHHTAIQWAHQKLPFSQGEKLGLSVSGQIMKEWPCLLLKALNLSFLAWVGLSSVCTVTFFLQQFGGELCAPWDSELF